MKLYSPKTATIKASKAPGLRPGKTSMKTLKAKTSSIKIKMPKVAKGRAVKVKV